MLRTSVAHGTLTERLTLASRAAGRDGHRHQNGHTWNGGWRAARSLLEWGPAAAPRAEGAGGAASPRGSGRAPPPAHTSHPDHPVQPSAPASHAPLSWALISPGRAIQLRVARCISWCCPLSALLSASALSPFIDYSDICFPPDAGGSAFMTL